MRMKHLAFAISLIGVAGIASVRADDQPSATPDQTSKIEVTGSHIHRTNSETPSPVQVISSEEIKASGATDISDVLRQITANGQGTLSQSFSQAFASGGSGIALRGLTVGATLVLVDGHRMAPYPLSDDGQRSFVDISAIPFDAVDHIEVLKDGASAVYGSDAMAGVVNVILKKSYTGSKITAEYGESYLGDGKTTHVAGITGWGDLDTDGQNGYVSMEYRHQEPILLTNRPNLNRPNWTSAGGADLTPGASDNPVPLSATGYFLPPISATTTPFATTGTSNTFLPGCGPATYLANQCTFQPTWSQVQPETENINLLGRYNLNFGEGWTLALSGSMFQAKDNIQTAPFGGPGQYAVSGAPVFGAGLQPGPQVNVLTPTFTAPLPANLAAQYGVPAGTAAPLVYMFSDFGPEVNTIKSTTYRGAADISGNWLGWDIQAAVGGSKIITDSTLSGIPNVVSLQNAINSGAYQIGIQNNAGLLANIAPHVNGEYTDSLYYGEVNGSRELFRLPGGYAALAAGLQFVHRDLNVVPPVATSSALQPSEGGSAEAIGKQSTTSVYAEFNAPVLKTLEIDAAARLDHVDTYGNSFTPKIGFKFTPMEQLAFRGTYSQGFRAPNPAENGNAGSVFYLGSTNDPNLCPNPSNPKAAGNFYGECSVDQSGVTLANKNLQPEKSKSYTFGTIIEPAKWISATVDYYDIRIDNQIIAAYQDPSYQAQQVFSSTPYSGLMYNAAGQLVPGSNPSGPLLYTIYPYLNAQSTETTGIDLDLTNKFSLGSYGKLKTDLTWSHMFKYTETVPGAPSVDLAGTHGPSGISGDTGNPRNRAQFKITWNRGPLEVAGTLNYVGGMSVTDPSTAAYTTCAGALAGASSAVFNSAAFPTGSNIPSQYCNVKSFTDFDLYTRYDINKQAEVHLSVTNLFNVAPPVDLQTYGGPFYNPSMAQAGAVGRFFTLGASYKF